MTRVGETSGRREMTAWVLIRRGTLVRIRRTRVTTLIRMDRAATAEVGMVVAATAEAEAGAIERVATWHALVPIGD